jgi:SAM-dependent methyltransferase
MGLDAAGGERIGEGDGENRAAAATATPARSVIWHDLECGAYNADLALWRELAGTPPTSVLDVGAGTGRVALELARAGHRVTALDLDSELLAALSERAAGLSVETVCADAREFALERRDFALCLAPMQTIQLLGGADGRVRFLRCARAHLAPGGVLACAIATEVDAFDCDAGDIGPSPEIVLLNNTSYISRATRVRIGRRVVRIERERSVLAADEESTPAPAWERDVIELDRVSVAGLEREGIEAGLRSAGIRAIAATEEHTASVAVIFHA